MTDMKREEETRRRPEVRGSGTERERIHEREQDDPGRGQGDVLDEQVHRPPAGNEASRKPR